eukprot:356135-Chlamydomonas_euryale.AAC.9
MRRGAARGAAAPCRAAESLDRDLRPHTYARPGRRRARGRAAAKAAAAQAARRKERDCGMPRSRAGPPKHALRLLAAHRRRHAAQAECAPREGCAGRRGGLPCGAQEAAKAGI